MYKKKHETVIRWQRFYLFFYFRSSLSTSSCKTILCSTVAIITRVYIYILHYDTIKFIFIFLLYSNKITAETREKTNTFFYGFFVNPPIPHHYNMENRYIILCVFCLPRSCISRYTLYAFLSYTYIDLILDAVTVKRSRPNRAH